MSPSKQDSATARAAATDAQLLDDLEQVADQVVWRRLPADTGGGAVVSGDGYMVAYVDPLLNPEQPRDALAWCLAEADRRRAAAALVDPEEAIERAMARARAVRAAEVAEIRLLEDDADGAITSNTAEVNA